MARAIDGEELLGIERLLDTDVVRKNETASWLLDQVLHDIQAMPTPTPPNEPLTFAELEKLDGQPVYIPKLHAWGLVNVSENTLYNYNGWAIKLYETSLMGVYRRPPEGEEDA